MTQITTMKVAAVSAMAGLLLVMGAFLMMSSSVGAQTPSPTPQEQTAPGQTPSAPDGTERTRPATKAECDKDGDGQPDGDSGTGAGVRGRTAPRSLAQ